MRSIILIGFLVATLACSSPKPADVVIIAHTIHTADPALPQAEAVAIRRGVIIDVGSEAEIASHIVEGTQVITLPEAYVYPGFIDSHMHLEGVGRREMTLNLEGTTGIEDLQQRIAAALREQPQGEWLRGRGWIETHWQPSRFPTRHDLDAVSPDHPVIVTRADGHALVANSRALAIAGIDAGTEAPFGGAILKDDAGEPTGMLVDNAMELLTPHLPNDSDTRAEAFKVGAERYARYGWTMAQVAGTTWEEANLLERLSNDREIPIRIYNAISGENDEARKLLRTGATINAANGMYTRRTLKFSIDGALGSRGAALLEPYADADTDGLLMLKEEYLLPIFEDALRRGVQVETHAIGDRGNRLVLDLYEQAFANVPEAERKIKNPRWRIEHAQILSPQDIARFAKMNVIPSMQASHAIGDLHFAAKRLGKERLAGAYAWRALRDSGVIIAGGTDAPVEAGDPRIEFYAMIARRDLSGYQDESWHPEQALNRADALASLTLWPAMASFNEDRLGSIAIGKLADFTILDTDLMTAEPQDIPGSRVVMTIVNGRIVHDGRRSTDD